MGIIEWLNANRGAVIAIAAVIFVDIISHRKKKLIVKKEVK